MFQITNAVFPEAELIPAGPLEPEFGGVEFF
jgi:hypothetical protein